jgi:hypothetical protein
MQIEFCIFVKISKRKAMLIEVKKPVTLNKLLEASKNIRTKKNRKRFNARKYFGKLKNVFGDPLEFQKRLRNEWN